MRYEATIAILTTLAAVTFGVGEFDALLATSTTMSGASSTTTRAPAGSSPATVTASEAESWPIARSVRPAVRRKPVVLDHAIADRHVLDQRRRARIPGHYEDLRQLHTDHVLQGLGLHFSCHSKIGYRCHNPTIFDQVAAEPDKVPPLVSHQRWEERISYRLRTEFGVAVIDDASEEG